MLIWSSFADLPDPRTGNAQRQNLLDLLTLALTATICGAESCVDVADFARDREVLFRDFLELECAPLGGQLSSGCFDRLPGVLVFELRGAEIAQSGM